MFTVVALLHVAAWGTLLLTVLPAHYLVGGQIFGLGLGVTAYTLGLRHAFDADHLAAIDNTTRKLMNDRGERAVSVGFWFALGHSSVVVILAVLIAAGGRAVGLLTADGSGVHQVLSVAGTALAGAFLYLIGALNLAVLVRILQVFRRARRGEYDEAALEDQLNNRGLFNRFLKGVTRSVRHPAQMYPLGLLFGLGFDTATEVTVLVLAGTGASGGLPWYAILVLPLLFTAGMTLLDSVDGILMNFAYGWAFARPIRKLYYNVTITGLSVSVALLVGTIEFVSLLHDDFSLDDPVTGWVAALNLNNVGLFIAGLFLVVWLGAIAYWRMARLEERFAGLTGLSASTPNTPDPGV